MLQVIGWQVSAAAAKGDAQRAAGDDHDGAP
jgi:hypothetical protein